MGWDDNGLPTERRVENYFGVRCDPSLPYDPAFAPPDAPGPNGKVAVLAPQLRRAVPAPIAEDEVAFEELWRRLGLSVDWTHDLHDDQRRAASGPASAPSSATSRGVRPTRPRRRRSGTSTYQTAVAQAEIEDREQAGAYHRYGFARPRRVEGHGRDDPPRAAGGLRRPRRPSRPTPGTSRCSARPSARPCSRCEVPVVAHELAQPDKGSGIAMICTFGDTTDVTWWRELSCRRASIVERNGRIKTRDAGVDHVATRDVRRYAELAGKTVKPGAGADRGAARRGGRARRRARADHPLRSSSTSGATGRSRSSARGSGTSATAAATRRSATRCSRAGRELQWHPAVHAPPVRVVGRGAQRRLAGQPAALLRRAVPGLVPGRRRRRARPRRTRSSPDEATLPVDPSSDTPAGLQPRTSGASRGDSSATPTSWTPGPRRR